MQRGLHTLIHCIPISYITTTLFCIIIFILDTFESNACLAAPDAERLGLGSG